MKNIISKFLPLMAFVALMLTASHLPASAGEGDKYMGAPAPAQAWGPGLMVRLRGLAVLPDEDGSNITANGASGFWSQKTKPAENRSGPRATNSLPWTEGPLSPVNLLQ